MSDTPLVSIIMNCYNGETYLREALDSVLAQTYQNWEVIFWDNQSTDQSANIFKIYDDERLKYFYAPKHTLLYEARNYAIEKAAGEFFAFLDVDDWWIPEKLELQIPLFADPEVGLVYGNYWFENEVKCTSKIQYRFKLPTGIILNELLKKYVVGLLTIVIRRSSLDAEKHPFNARYHIIGDFDCAIRLSVNWKFNCVQEPVAYYRWYGDNETNKNKEKQIQELEHWYCEMMQIDILAVEFIFLNVVHNNILYMKGKLELENHRFLKAFYLLKELPIGIMKLKLFLFYILPKKLINLFTA